jgi:hypothetical protein
MYKLHTFTILLQLSMARMVRSPSNADRQIYRSLYSPRTKCAVKGQSPRVTPEGDFVVQVIEGVEICHSEHLIDVLAEGNHLDVLKSKT